MKRIALLLTLVPCLAFGQGTNRSGPVTTQKIDPRSAARYVFVQTASVATVANGSVAVFIVPVASRLVDVIVFQGGAGTVGTSYTVDVMTEAASPVSLLSTLGVATQASGVRQKTDAKGEIALPSGWTRPVIKTDATPTVTKGSKLQVWTVETGSYSTHATLQVVMVFEPLT